MRNVPDFSFDLSSSSTERLHQLPSLHRTRPAGQEVLHVRRHGLGEVGHAPEAAAGGAVVQQPAHAGGRIPLQDVLLRPQVLLQEDENKETLPELITNTNSGSESVMTSC